MRQYHTKIEIDAPAQDVWRVLTNFTTYNEWNPLVRSVTGDIQEGGTIKTEIIPLENIFSAKLLSFKPNQEIIWEGKMGAKFLLAGKHYYHIIQLNEATCLLKHGEYFSGLLSYLIPSNLLRKMEDAFARHNRALKSKVENGK